MSKTGLYSSVDVSILHKDRRGQYSLSSIFLNPKLMAVSLMHTIASFRKLIFSLRSMSLLFMVSVLRRVSSGTDHFSHGFANPCGYPGMGGMYHSPTIRQTQQDTQDTSPNTTTRRWEGGEGARRTRVGMGRHAHPHKRYVFKLNTTLLTPSLPSLAVPLPHSTPHRMHTHESTQRGGCPLLAASMHVQPVVQTHTGFGTRTTREYPWVTVTGPSRIHYFN